MNEKLSMRDRIAALLMGPEAGSASSGSIDEYVRKHPKEIIDRLYGILNVLDSKANGLLRINSLFIAAGVAIKTFSLKDVGLIPSLCGLISLLFLVISCVMCMSIVRIKWHFLDKVVEKDGSFDFKREVEELSGVAVERTKSYIGAWWLSVLGLSIFVAALMIFLYF
ncbi:MAG: hypothetical protein HQL45_05360 [Alphaproteobacteria bacterium]|nr:hypothetical protein [Alphaproteobacteria bacterium]